MNLGNHRYFHGYSFAAAQLVYNMMTCLSRSAPNRDRYGLDLAG